MLKTWVTFVCIFLPATLALLAVRGFADGAVGATLYAPLDPNTAPSVCAGSTLSGVDVSDHQNTQSWATALRSGKQFTFVKATEGTTFVSADFQKDWSGAKQAGVLRGSYHFFTPAEDPATQASYYLANTGTLSSDDLPPMLDWESASTLSNAQIIARAQTWLAKVEESTGRTPVIYTNPNYWQKLGNPEGFSRYPLFIADYDVPCPRIPATWKTWTFWQHAIGVVPGISANTDEDYFNGLMAALKDL